VCLLVLGWQCSLGPQEQGQEEEVRLQELVLQGLELGVLQAEVLPWGVGVGEGPQTQEVQMCGL